ncbi:hypothetical protein VKT23_009034 [Stygiomarasmius scandens]|uniref:Uncharacterized protein n=1 Tax=Marasmiellus scandens TaxID=2682957 RepID=A0ABR1JG82_9AGAR
MVDTTNFTESELAEAEKGSLLSSPPRHYHLDPNVDLEKSPTLLTLTHTSSHNKQLQTWEKRFEDLEGIVKGLGAKNSLLASRMESLQDQVDKLEVKNSRLVDRVELLEVNLGLREGRQRELVERRNQAGKHELEVTGYRAQIERYEEEQLIISRYKIPQSLAEDLDTSLRSIYPSIFWDERTPDLLSAFSNIVVSIYVTQCCHGSDLFHPLEPKDLPGFNTLKAHRNFLVSRFSDTRPVRFLKGSNGSSFVYHAMQPLHQMRAERANRNYTVTMDGGEVLIEDLLFQMECVVEMRVKALKNGGDMRSVVHYKPSTKEVEAFLVQDCDKVSEEVWDVAYSTVVKRWGCHLDRNRLGSLRYPVE